MITENIRQLLSRKLRDLSGDFFECIIVWREDGQIRPRVNHFDQTHRLQGSHDAC